MAAAVDGKEEEPEDGEKAEVVPPAVRRKNPLLPFFKKVLNKLAEVLPTRRIVMNLEINALKKREQTIVNI